VERLLRRLAIASLLATTIIFPSLRAIFRPSLRASRLSVIARQQAWQSLPSILNDLVKIAASLGYRLAPRNDYNTLSPLRRSADGLIGMTANKIIALVVRLFFLMF